ncbi:conserved hypothetical protein [Chloroherpeton thalassium ATCC 35110]|uniref:Toxin-antitoxin system, antitoxin component, ribbon-helix-helix domain protein n=1 Tax=Chloroherpeton thalassium (strain ATCC 35110 / GB-78) TaxID=517418 RepID=B3QUZ5_CHLT3|nr:hypothetical protein [Chloroherpeton thalassium]ACF14496.1 conserved hypothetical protein [Chloroherpeton thalassium ATCC 35110]
MLKNIILSADEILIRKARRKAEEEHTTLNSRFQEWLKNYTSTDFNASDYDDLMNRFSYAKPTGKYSRDEMNER